MFLLYCCRSYCNILIDLTESDSIDSIQPESPSDGCSATKPSGESITPTRSSATVTNILQKHREDVYKDVDELDLLFQTITVRRYCLFEDAMRVLSRSSFDWDKPIEVHFIGESAADGGGPRREFLALLVQGLSASGMFEGCPNHLFPSHDVAALAQGRYKIAGKIIAWSIMQGGPAFTVLAEPVVDYLITGNMPSPARLEHLPDYTISHKMQKVCVLWWEILCYL